MFKIAITNDAAQFFTDANAINLARWIADTLPKVRAAVKAGEFTDVRGGMACQPFDLPFHWHHNTPEIIAARTDFAEVDPYAAALATLVGGTLEEVTSGGYVSWFWIDGPGAEITRCRTAKGILAKLTAHAA